MANVSVEVLVDAGMLKQMGSYASLNYNIYISADAIPVDLDHGCACVPLHFAPTMFTH